MCNPAIPPLGIYSREMKTHVNDEPVNVSSRIIHKTHTGNNPCLPTSGSMLKNGGVFIQLSVVNYDKD